MKFHLSSHNCALDQPSSVPMMYSKGEKPPFYCSFTGGSRLCWVAENGASTLVSINGQLITVYHLKNSLKLATGPQNIFFSQIWQNTCRIAHVWANLEDTHGLTNTSTVLSKKCLYLALDSPMRSTKAERLNLICVSDVHKLMFRTKSCKLSPCCRIYWYCRYLSIGVIGYIY